MKETSDPAQSETGHVWFAVLCLEWPRISLLFVSTHGDNAITYKRKNAFAHQVSVATRCLSGSSCACGLFFANPFGTGWCGSPWSTAPLCYLWYQNCNHIETWCTKVLYRRSLDTQSLWEERMKWRWSGEQKANTINHFFKQGPSQNILNDIFIILADLK